jgi:hypothetical protein
MKFKIAESMPSDKGTLCWSTQANHMTRIDTTVAAKMAIYVSISGAKGSLLHLEGVKQGNKSHKRASAQSQCPIRISCLELPRSGQLY